MQILCDLNSMLYARGLSLRNPSLTLFTLLEENREIESRKKQAKKIGWIVINLESRNRGMIDYLFRNTASVFSQQLKTRVR